MTATRPSSDATVSGIHCRDYALLPKIHDEMMAPDGQLRPHWRGFVAGLEKMSPDDLEGRLRKAERLLRENGLTYSITTAAEGSERPWELDFVPLVLPADEWAHLEVGLIQRVRLLNAILVDLYGPRRLLKDNHLPAALIFANPHFLRPCHGIEPRDGIYLHLYAADLGRGPDGRWWVLADRTQAPLGTGYALENRIVLSRSLRNLFRLHHVHRLAAFFQAMHNGLMARTGRDDPRIVLLTPGASADGYFDHAFVARYLGYTLAGSADLTVRGNRVFLKTVEGLKPVDLIVRGIDAEHCDPIELQSLAGLGVSGLFEAVRAGTVTMANALGSGIVETRAFMAFLPKLCRVLLDEELILPNTATWWCGQSGARAHVIENLGHLALDLAFERRPLLTKASRPVLGSELTAAEARAIKEGVATRGHAYVAQEMVSLSTTPVWLNGALQPRPMSVRVFVAAAAEGYTVMPGGLTRVSSTSDPRAVVLRRGEGAKDTWVLSEEKVPAFSLLRTSSNVLQPRRTSKDIPSHSADNLFWLGRYAERAEDIMRVLRSVLRRLTEEIDLSNDLAALEGVVQVLLKKTGIEAPTEAERRQGPTVGLERQIQALLHGPDHPYALQDTANNLSRTSVLARDWLSSEAWRTISGFHMNATRRPANAALDVSEELERMDDGLQMLAAFSGMEMENMTRDHGWRFLDMGRRLERARHLSRLMKALLVAGDPEEDGSLVLLLELADSIMTYRWRYLTTPMVAPVIDLLLIDETNPRSVAFQINVMERHVNDLPRDPHPPVRSIEQRLILSLSTGIRLAEIPVLCTRDRRGQRTELAALLGQVEDGMPEFSEAITRSYFSHAEARAPADLAGRLGPS